jgi:hypothetical protein
MHKSSRIVIVGVQVGRSSENICSHSGGANLIYKFTTFVRAFV